MTRTASLAAFAKLNVGLRVLRKREDGYHELRTVFQTISLADRMGISFAPATETTVRIEGTPEIQDNLVERAARAVLDEIGVCASVEFELKKQIPAGAGLGGGSTDAAAVLLALPVLAGAGIPAPRLFELAAQLGSDVPFFLHGGTALGSGRGEELYPLPDLSSRHVLLVAPRVHSSTAEAYGDLSVTLTPNSIENKLSSFQRQVWRNAVGEPANDFEEVVFARYPELLAIRDRLLNAGAKLAAMTGSGAALFGIFEDPAALQRAKDLLQGERTFVISFLSRARYRSAWRRALAPHIRKSNSKEDIWPPQSLYER
jgi:4-diphosphocytidyl-2-C-methyl-D-erythritol kinase